jgi:hypothetical protein
MNLRRVVIEAAQRAKRRADLVLDPSAHFRRGGFQLFQGKCKAGHYRLLIICVRSSSLMSRKIGAGVDPGQSIGGMLGSPASR